MWLLYALCTFFAWGAADLFYKKGADASENCSHLKTSIVVGIIMGITAIITLLTNDLHYDFRNLLVYLPVSSMYILSMTIGYFGLRYLTLSVCSPIQNASGAVSAILLMLVLKELPDRYTCIALALITIGVVLLGVYERQEEISGNASAPSKYKIGFVAFLMPILYCVIDSLGTFFDGWYLDDVTKTPLIGVTEDTLENVANVSYQLTFLIVAILLLLYLRFVRKEPFIIKAQKNRLFAALFENFGQLTYVYALSGNGIAAAPVIASYCVASLIFGRIFLQEKLEKKQYLAVSLVIAGIIILGILEGVAEA